MKMQLLLLFLLLGSSFHAQKPSLQEIRLLYREAESEENSAELLLERLESVGEEQPVLLAYKASGTMLVAKYAFLPFKLSWFNKGKKLMQEAVDAAPEEVEIRFLRFALQANTPGFLGYKDHMEEDKALLLKRLPEVKDDNLKQLMLPFLLNSEYLTETEKQSLSDIKAN